MYCGCGVMIMATDSRYCLLYLSVPVFESEVSEYVQHWNSHLNSAKPQAVFPMRC